MSNWNPLYPSNEDVDPLEESAREAEWEDDMKRSEVAWRKKQKPENGDEDFEDLFS